MSDYIQAPLLHYKERVFIDTVNVHTHTIPIAAISYLSIYDQFISNIWGFDVFSNIGLAAQMWSDVVQNATMYVVLSSTSYPAGTVIAANPAAAADVWQNITRTTNALIPTWLRGWAGAAFPTGVLGVQPTPMYLTVWIGSTTPGAQVFVSAQNVRAWDFLTGVMS